MEENQKASHGNSITGRDSIVKTRKGFVSNSSSSSFIVAFEKVPDALHEVFELMFDKDEKVIDLYDSKYDTTTIAQIVYRDIQRIMDDTDPTPFSERYTKEGKIISEEELAKHIATGSFDGMPESMWNDRNRESEKLTRQARKEGVDNPWTDDKWKELIKKAYDKEWKEYDKQTNESAREKVAKPFWEKHRDKTLLVFEYSDNDGSLYSTMEHGDIFNKLPHIRISHH